jgi:hypothetical protein
MRKWYLSLTMLGLGGVGALLLTESGRRAMHWVADNIEHGSNALADWEIAAQDELDRIQLAVNELAQSLQAAR